jgi:YbgC/YbaW family acyl-CoA thioester hydrolase
MLRYHLRILYFYLRWRWAGKPLEPVSRLTLRASVFDCDLLGHINNARYLEIFDAGRTDLFLRLGLFDAARKGRWLMVVGSINVRYRRELRRGVRFTMESTFVRIEGKAMVYAQRIFLGEMLATEAEVHILVVKEKKVIAPDFLLPVLPLPAGASSDT